MDQTLVEVQEAHDTDDEVNEDKKHRNGRYRAKETPLDESPSECPRIKHETNSDEVQSRQDEEHHHGVFPLQSRCKPALRWRHQRSTKMNTNKDLPSKAKELSTTKVHMS